MAKGERSGNRLTTAPGVRVFVTIGLALVAISLAADLFRERHGEFGFDGWIGFHAAFGFVAGLAIIGVAKALGAALKRPASYYDKRR